MRQSSGVSGATRQMNRCGCGNAVAGGSGHCWSVGGNVHTKTGASDGWLSSKLTGSSGDVVGSPRRLGVAQRGAAWGFSNHFSGDFLNGGEDGMREKPRRIPQHCGATHCGQRE